MTDIKVGDKNIKQHIDTALFEDPNASLGSKWQSLKARVLNEPKSEPAPAEKASAPAAPPTVPVKEGLSKQDRQKLENFIDKHD